jgi:hypothetical protein
MNIGLLLFFTVLCIGIADKLRLMRAEKEKAAPVTAFTVQ